MGQIPSPNKGKPFTDVVGDEGLYYEESRQERIIVHEPIDPLRPEKGIKAVEKTVTVPINPEIVNLQTGESNTKYWKPEVVFDPTGCEHEFKITVPAQRIAECKCGLVITFHAVNDFVEKDGKAFINFNRHQYPVIL